MNFGSPFSAAPLSGHEQLSFPGPASGNGIIQTILTGASATVLPAPPAGFGYLISELSIANNDAAQAGVVRFTENSLLLGAVPVSAASSIGIEWGVPHVSVAAVVAAVSGSAASVTIYFNYRLISLADVFRTQLALTTSYQTISLASIPSGKGAAVLSAIGSGGYPGDRVLWVANNDGATRTISIRVTRGSEVLTWNSSATLATQRRTGALNVVRMPMLRPTDVLEVKASAVSTPGEVTFGMCLPIITLL